MLTRDTASSLGIQNRTDPTKSIVGGARYFQSLEKRLPRRIGKADRIWIALAAYNVGMGHIKDAQYLARRMGKNPHAWNDLKTMLPLLAQKPYYETLRYGYAPRVGARPVREAHPRLPRLAPAIPQRNLIPYPSVLSFVFVAASLV